jgi:Mg2+/Co2+ transporter CorB
MELALAILLLAFSAFFSGSETAFTSLTLIDQKVLENKKGSRAKTPVFRELTL